MSKLRKLTDGIGLDNSPLWFKLLHSAIMVGLAVLWWVVIKPANWIWEKYYGTTVCIRNDGYHNTGTINSQEENQETSLIGRKIERHVDTT